MIKKSIIIASVFCLMLAGGTDPEEVHAGIASFLDQAPRREGGSVIYFSTKLPKPYSLAKPHPSGASFVDKQGEVVDLFIVPLVQNDFVNYESGVWEDLRMLLPNGESRILEPGFPFQIFVLKGDCGSSKMAQDLAMQLGTNDPEVINLIRHCCACHIDSCLTHNEGLNTRESFSITEDDIGCHLSLEDKRIPLPVCSWVNKTTEINELLLIAESPGTITFEGKPADLYLYVDEFELPRPPLTRYGIVCVYDEA
jgi:hypothetical protein